LSHKGNPFHPLRNILIQGADHEKENHPSLTLLYAACIMLAGAFCRMRYESAGAGGFPDPNEKYRLPERGKTNTR
jgi:hypothetical protein